MRSAPSSRSPLRPSGPRVQRFAEESVVRLKGGWLRYGRGEDWALRGADLNVAAGESRALVGGNGSGKSTLLSAVAGILKPQRGRVRNALASSQALLPQSPKALLSHETVHAELMAWSSRRGYGESECDDMLARLGMTASEVLDAHPYDLSGGQQQLLALAKLALARPRLLMLDEPTKGLDGEARAAVADLVTELRAKGCTLLVATHDMEFVQATCDAVSLLFDGGIACTLETQAFFSSTQFFLP